MLIADGDSTGAGISSIFSPKEEEFATYHMQSHNQKQY